MKIIEMLLDINNSYQVLGVPVKERIKSSGKSCLWNERGDAKVDTVIIHYISAVEVTPKTPFDLDQIIKIFCGYGVSSHYLISRRGKVYRLVPEEKRAWHCGGSIMPEPDNRKGVNDFSIGIELMAIAGGAFTNSQYKALCGLCIQIEKRYGKKFNYAGHDQIAGERAVALGLRKDCKVDPGPQFDWGRFRKGVGD